MKATKNLFGLPDFASNAPYERTKLPDPYGYLEAHYGIFPSKARNTSLEISGQMTQSYHAQARIWAARGRMIKPWVWLDSLDRESMWYESRLAVPSRIDTGWVDKPKVICLVEERLRLVFSHIRVLTLPRERIQLLNLRVEDEQEAHGPISLERAIFHRPSRWYYGVQTR